MPTSRSALRSELRERRRAVPAPARIAAAQALAAQLLALPFAPRTGFVAGYWASDGEIALHAWQLGLPAGVRYCLPVLAEDGRLLFAPWRAGEGLATNRFGIPEPDTARAQWLEPDAMAMVVAPLVGFDRARNRLGMGGGWYDRSFAFRKTSLAPPWLVGAGFALQAVPRIETAAWDVRLDAICTERGTLLDTGDAA